MVDSEGFSMIRSSKKSIRKNPWFTLIQKVLNKRSGRGIPEGTEWEERSL